MKICSVDGCGGLYRARGYCGKHYERWRAHGDISVRNTRYGPVDYTKRIFSRFKKSETGCWEWQYSKSHDGYGLFGMNGLQRYAHRVVYELLVGKIPDGLTLDHLCRNRCCVNPAHLEPVTLLENMSRGESFCAKNKRKTHCLRGHPLFGDNLRLKNREGSIRRVCRACHREDYHRRKDDNAASRMETAGAIT